MVKRWVVVLCAMGVMPAAAEPAKLVIAKTASFDVYKPKAQCRTVTGALLAKLTKSYSCVAAAADESTGSGVKLVGTCTAKHGESTFMLFTSIADCNKERETQLANGEG